MVGHEVTALGFGWHPQSLPSDPAPSEVRRVLWRYTRTLPEFVWDAAQLEGNPFTYPEVQTLMDGITVGGHRLSDERQVLGLASSARELARLVDSGTFALTKEVSDRLHDLIARDEALEAGRFRGEGRETATPSVYLGIHGRHTPPATEPGGANLRDLYAAGLAELATIDTVHGRAIGYFLFAALQQFYFDGNKRTGRAMMNGLLLQHGFDAISVPAAARAEFNAAMVEFYRTRDASAMFALMPTFGPTDR